MKIVFLVYSLLVLVPITILAEDSDAKFTITYNDGETDVTKTITPEGIFVDYSKHYRIEITNFGDKQYELFLGEGENEKKLEGGDWEFKQNKPGSIELLFVGDMVDLVKGSSLVIKSESIQGNDNNSGSTSIVQAIITFDTAIPETATQWILTTEPYKSYLFAKESGLILEEIKDPKLNGRLYSGPNFIHLFFNEKGNSIIRGIPRGIASMKYVVHIVYFSKVTTHTHANYVIYQKHGRAESKLHFANTKNIPEYPSVHNINGKKWQEDVFLLSASEEDIAFDILWVSNGEDTLLASHSISMSPVSHMTFDIGLIKTKVSNPTYTMVALSENEEKKTVIEKENGNRGVITLMATFYSSPIVYLSRYWDDKPPEYQLYGRNFLHDHRLHYRLYPTLGIQLNDSQFENLFIGLNWEFARGGSIFWGWHYGKVNTFNKSDNFIFGKSELKESEFEIRTNTEWKLNTAFGVNIDSAIMRRLLPSAE